METSYSEARRAIVDAAESRDPVYRFARMCLYLGLFFSSLLVLRVGTLTVGDVFLVAAIVCAGVARLVNTRVRWPKSYYSLPANALILVMFLTGALLSTTVALQPSESLAVILRLLIVVFALPWLARLLLPSSEHLSRAAGWFLAGAAAAATGTILQFQFGGEVIPGGEVTNAGRFTGFTGHVSDMGGIASVGIAIGVGFLITRGRRFVALIAVGVAAVGLVLSGSVSGILAVGAGLLVYVVRRHMKLRYLLLLGVAGAAVLWIVASIQAQVSALSPVDRFMQTLGLSSGGAYSTSEIRSETYQIALAHVLQSPIIGNGLDPLSGIADGTFPAHNFLIAALFQGGVLVAISLLAMLLRPLSGKWMRADRTVIATQVLAAFAAAVVFAMTAPSLYNRYMWIPVALVVVARSIALASRDAQLPPVADLSSTRSSARSR